MMIDQEELAKIEKYVEKHLSWNTPFKSTSDFVSYFMINQENRLKNNSA